MSILLQNLIENPKLIEKFLPKCCKCKCMLTFENGQYTYDQQLICDDCYYTLISDLVESN